MSSEQSLRKFIPSLIYVAIRRIKGATRVFGKLPAHTPYPAGVCITLNRERAVQAFNGDLPLNEYMRVVTDYSGDGGYPGDLYIVLDLQEEEENEFGTVSP